LTVGDKIRLYRTNRGISQVKLAELSGINVGTIRKYELGLRNPKPDQLSKIASALGLNVSVFFDFNVENAGDVLSLLFAIDEAVDLDLNYSKESETVTINFERKDIQDIIVAWAKLKDLTKRATAAADELGDEEKKKEFLAEIENAIRNWKILVMGNAFGANYIITEGPYGAVFRAVNTYKKNED